MPLPVVTVAQMREWEKATWASGQTEAFVIEQAGAAVARKAESVTHPNDLIVVLSGKGHNGDDARVAAGLIRDRDVQVLRVIDAEKAGAELASFLARKPALLTDGFFRNGLNLPPGLPWFRLNQH